MKCREFEAVVADLARGRGIEEASVRDAGAHAESCRKCAARLAAEREVTNALSALAQSTRDCGAPERVERALAAAFAQRKEERPARRPARVPVVRWWGFAAAGLAALLAVSVWLGAPRAVEAPVVVASKPQPKPEPVPPATRVVPPAVNVTAAPGKPRRRELTTRFYPLQYVDTTADLENGPMVRVQVPRATLLAFGLPIDQGRAADPVQADVALDDDTGMARAIRFVRVAGN